MSGNLCRWIALVPLAVYGLASRVDAGSIGEIDVRAAPAASSPAPTDSSALWIKSKTRVTILLTDPKGRRLGYDPKSAKTLQEIPEAKCDLEFITNRYTGDEKDEAYEELSLEPAMEGQYRIDVFALQEGPFEVNISALSRNGSSEPTRDLEGMVRQGQTKTFRLTFDASPNTPLSIVERH
jgi:hypothetical protein